MAESSYDKVSRLISETAEGRAVMAKARERMATLRVTDVMFQLARPEKLGDPARATPRFVVGNCDGELTKTENGSIWLNGSSFVMQRECKQAVEATFGIKVKTYFIRKDVLLGDTRRRGTNDFHNWMSSRFSELHGQEMEAVKTRILEQVRDMRASGDLVAREHEFLARCAVDDIKKALASYKHLGEAVLKQAVQEFLVDDVFEYCDS